MLRFTTNQSLNYSPRSCCPKPLSCGTLLIAVGNVESDPSSAGNHYASKLTRYLK